MAISSLEGVGEAVHGWWEFDTRCPWHKNVNAPLFDQGPSLSTFEHKTFCCCVNTHL